MDVSQGGLPVGSGANSREKCAVINKAARAGAVRAGASQPLASDTEL